ncbi:hypothetical protein [Caulobacter sp. LARHSG274]
MNAQAHYWNQFVQLKRDAAYIGKYHAADEAADRWLNILSAVASSTSIGAWAVWRDHAIVWAVIIAASQVLTAIRAYLPYKARLRALATLGVDLEALALVAETDWFKVSRGALEAADVHALTMALKTKAPRATSRSFNGASLPERTKLLQSAEAATRHYMAAFTQEA